MFGGFIKRTLVTLWAVCLVTVLLAGPAHADHVAEISADGGTCVLGALASSSMGMGFRLVTDRASIDVDHATGDLTYICHFDIPAYRASENTMYMTRDWFLPRTPIKKDGLGCLAPGHSLAVTSYNSRVVITPSGNGILRCTFQGFVPPAT